MNQDCPKCGGPLATRPLYPYPILLQVLFGISFVAFLILFEQIKVHRQLLWLWSLLQLGLGILLVRGRIRARKTVLRCIRCSQALR
ncbi:MAG TPA: hypothetical protein VJB59_04805 [Bdellovibrionota bacterium]|nr:hypothetical protein [Bdellovibrionota bacterium]